MPAAPACLVAITCDTSSTTNRLWQPSHVTPSEDVACASWQTREQKKLNAPLRSSICQLSWTANRFEQTLHVSVIAMGYASRAAEGSGPAGTYGSASGSSLRGVPGPGQESVTGHGSRGNCSARRRVGRP